MANVAQNGQFQFHTVTAPTFRRGRFRGISVTLDAGAGLRAGVASLECATLVLAHSAPHACILAGVQCPGQALGRDRAAVAHELRVSNLGKCRATVSHREEQFRILVATDRLVAPIHGSTLLTMCAAGRTSFFSAVNAREQIVSALLLTSMLPHAEQVSIPFGNSWGISLRQSVRNRLTRLYYTQPTCALDAQPRWYLCRSGAYHRWRDHAESLRHRPERHILAHSEVIPVDLAGHRDVTGHPDPPEVVVADQVPGADLGLLRQHLPDQPQVGPDIHAGRRENAEAGLECGVRVRPHRPGVGIGP